MTVPAGFGWRSAWGRFARFPRYAGWIEKQRHLASMLGPIGPALVNLYDRMVKDDVFTLASSIAYTAILSVFPLLLASIAFLELFIARGHAQQTVMQILAPYLPPSARP